MIDGPPRWVERALKIAFWAIAAVAAVAGALAMAWIVMVIVAIVGYELGLSGPPFGGE